MSVAYIPPCVNEQCDTPVELASAAAYGTEHLGSQVGDISSNRTISQVCLALCEIDSSKPFEQRVIQPRECALAAVLKKSEERKLQLNWKQIRENSASLEAFIAQRGDKDA